MISDIVRWYVVITALWLIAVMLRITYVRLRNGGGVRGLWRRFMGR